MNKAVLTLELKIHDVELLSQTFDLAISYVKLKEASQDPPSCYQSILPYLEHKSSFLNKILPKMVELEESESNKQGA